MTREFECKNCKNSYQGDCGVEDTPIKEISCVICGKNTLIKFKNKV